MSKEIGDVDPALGNPVKRPRRLTTPEWCFLLVGTLYGLGFTFITPPFQVPDEGHHFMRAFSVSELSIVNEVVRKRLVGASLPESVWATATHTLGDLPFHPERKIDPSLVRSYLSTPLDPANRKFVDFRNTALYSPVPYVPQVIAIWVVRLAGGSPLVMMYAARLLTLAAWLAIMFWAIRICPIYKWLLSTICLIPVSVFVAASMSADAMTNAFATLVTARS